MRTRRRALALLLLVLAAFAVSAGGCSNPGTVIKVEWGEDSLGNPECDITIRPDDLDSAPYKLKDQRASRCRRCPVNSRWPDCNKAQDPQTTMPLRRWRA